MTDKAKQRRRGLAAQLGVSRRTAANIFAARRANASSTNRVTESDGIRIVPQFDPDDPKSASQVLAGGGYQDPIRPVQILSGARTVLVWILPTPEGSAGWRFEVKHRTGPWPLEDAERAALERWLEDFAESQWPDRTQLVPVLYSGASRSREPMRSDVLVRRYGDVVDAHYVVFRFDPAKGETLGDAVREARRTAQERADLLQASIRRMDRPGHPWVCRWTRRSTSDAWTFEWDDGADDRHAQPMVLAADPGREAAVAAWRVLESSGFEKLSPSDWAVLESAGLGRNRETEYGGVYAHGQTNTVRFYTMLPVTNPVTDITTNRVVVFSVIVETRKTYGQISTEPEGGIVWGVGEAPPTVEGSADLARRMVEHVRGHTRATSTATATQFR